MKNCTKCGTVNSDQAIHCTHCSAQLYQPTGPLCPKGVHIMDPSWGECKYCAGSSLNFPPPPPVPSGGEVQRRHTVIETPQEPGQLPPRLGPRLPAKPDNLPLPPRGYQPSQSPSPSPSPASPAVASHETPRRATVFAKAGPPSGEGTPNVAKNRRIVGVLVTYSWRAEGEMFKVLEGRNVIGRGAGCEISVPHDETMSTENSSITYRETFILRDRDSMSGTYLNGRPVEEQARVNNYCQIRAGSTVFTFVALEPAALESMVLPLQSQ